MTSLCILTDSSVQFIKPGFPGRSLVYIIPHRYFKNSLRDQEIKASDLPRTVYKENEDLFRIVPPSIEDFRQQFLTLGQSYNEIIVLLISSRVSPLIQIAEEAALTVHGRISVQVIDSQTTSVGLGFLVQLAAEAASKNANSTEIEQLIRGVIPHIYSVLCIPGLSYLYRSKFIDHAQAMTGEILGMLPVFSLEEGYLTSVTKVRNLHHLFEYFQGFLDEFSDLNHISFIQSIPAVPHESRVFREHAQNNFPGIPYSEHSINISLASLFGPRSLGVVVIEAADSE